MIFLLISFFFILSLVLFLRCPSSEQFGKGERIVFIHVPKNGGTSIKDAIRESILPIEFYSDHSKGMKSYDRSCKFLIVVRNPFDRFASAVNYSVDIWGVGKDILIEENIGDQMSRYLEDNLCAKHQWARDTILNDNQSNHNLDGRRCTYKWTYLPQSEWWDSKVPLENIYTLRFEHLEEDWLKFLRNHDFPIVNLPRRTQGKGESARIEVKTLPKVGIKYSDQSKKYLEQFYKEDFKLYKMSNKV